MMKRIAALAIAAAILPGTASALCYTVYGDKQVVLYRGSNPPIDLSGPVHEGMRKVFPPGSILVIAQDDNLCTPIGPQDFFGPMPGMTGPAPGMPQWQSGMTAAPQSAR